MQQCIRDKCLTRKGRKDGIIISGKSARGGGVQEPDVPLVVRPLRWFFFVFLDVGPSILFFVFPLFGVLWLIL
jgi:hypothetical protein